MIGGLKLGTSNANSVLATEVRQIELPLQIHEELSRRLILAFTGKPRLAKNILQNVLRRWARRTTEIIDAVHQLVTGAHGSIECLTKGEIDELGTYMSSYWDQKKIMAGLESGVEPNFVNRLLTLLYSQGVIVGGTLCGAGGEFNVSKVICNEFILILSHK